MRRDEVGGEQPPGKNAQHGKQGLKLQGGQAGDGMARGAASGVAGAETDQHAAANMTITLSQVKSNSTGGR